MVGNGDTLRCEGTTSSFFLLPIHGVDMVLGVHNVFHVSLLKKFHGDPSTNSLPLPHDIIVASPVIELQMVLAICSILSHGEPVQQLLIEWQGIPGSSATWEDESSFFQPYPDHNHEDTVMVDRGSTDRSQGANVKVTRVERECY